MEMASASLAPIVGIPPLGRKNPKQAVYQSLALTRRDFSPHLHAEFAYLCDDLGISCHAQLALNHLQHFNWIWALT